MSYLTQADLADDSDMRRRVTACATLEGIPAPEGWAYDHRWVLSAQPGWDAAYAYAIAQGTANPGADGAVISDAMIRASVQAIRADETPDPSPSL